MQQSVGQQLEMTKYNKCIFKKDFISEFQQVQIENTGNRQNGQQHKILAIFSRDLT